MSDFQEDITLGELSVIGIFIVGIAVSSYLALAGYLKIAVFFPSLALPLIPLFFFTKRLFNTTSTRRFLTWLILGFAAVNIILMSLAVNPTSLAPYFHLIFVINLIISSALIAIAAVKI